MEVSSKMSSKSRVEVLERARERYLNRGKEGQGRLLDEICSLCRYERKYAIKVLGGLRPIAGSRGKKRGGSVPKYGKEERRVFQVIWMAAEQPCGKRMKPTVKTWLPHYEKRHGQLGAQVRERILKASAATIDRLLAPSRFRYGKRRCATRPGSLLRSQIPVRTEHWDVEGPGFLEADTVAHCGGSLSGEHCWSLTVSDVHTQSTETRATPNRGQEAVRRKIADIEGCLPFAILGFDTDNGGEFLNWHLVDYFQKREKLVAFTRSRAYRKNDNARVEQKNRTHVRELIGYGRLEGKEVAEALNDLYAKEWSLFRNFFCPVMRLVRTEVKGSRRKRVYDEATTPFERLKACKNISPKELEHLEKKLTDLDPFVLREAIEGKLRKIWKLQKAKESRLAA
jgi:hypothetical protein